MDEGLTMGEGRWTGQSPARDDDGHDDGINVAVSNGSAQPFQGLFGCFGCLE